MPPSSVTPHRRRNINPRLWSLRLAVALIFGLAGLLLVAQLVSAARADDGSAAAFLQGTTVIGCGNGVCETKYEENCNTCPSDCGACSQCGNGVCESGETCGSCTTDCCPETICDPSTCGDGVCLWNDCENTANCGVDCVWCGDTVCAPSEIGVCCGDCGANPTLCGNGVCDPCETCAADCVVTTEPPTEPPTEEKITVTTPAIVTRVATTPARVTVTATDTPTSTATVTNTATATLTLTSTPSSTPEPEGCGLVPYESRPDTWQESYGKAVKPEGFIPVQDQDLEVWVCPVPPAGERLCIPIYDGLMEEAENDLARVKLVDCPDGGDCRTFDQVPERDGDQLCYIIGVDNTNPVCGVGCALAPLVPEPEPGLPPWWWIPLIALLLLLLLILLLARRRRDTEEDVAEETAGLATSSRAGAPTGTAGADTAPRNLQDTREHHFSDLNATRIDPPQDAGSQPGGDDDPGTTQLPPALRD